jgi:hypothetical protein
MAEDKNTRGGINIDPYDQELLNKIGTRVKQLREERIPEVSYEAFALKTGLNRTSQYRLERGHNFMMVNLIKFCRGIGISLEEFFSGLK